MAASVAERRPTEGEAQYAQRIVDYMQECYRKGWHKSALGGWVLDDIKRQLSGQRKWVQIHYLNSWRIPKDPLNASALLFPRLRGG